MNVNAKRRWYQIHLSTLVLITLMAGGFLQLNMTVFLSFLRDRDLGWTCGWPWGCWGVYHRGDTTSGGLVVRKGGRVVEFHFWPALCDVLVALLIIIAVALLFEWRIRRKEGRERTNE
jgi:hypothetical protein